MVEWRRVFSAVRRLAGLWNVESRVQRRLMRDHKLRDARAAAAQSRRTQLSHLTDAHTQAPAQTLAQAQQQMSQLEQATATAAATAPPAHSHTSPAQHTRTSYSTGTLAHVPDPALLHRLKVVKVDSKGDNPFVCSVTPHSLSFC